MDLSEFVLPLRRLDICVIWARQSDICCVCLAVEFFFAPSRELDTPAHPHPPPPRTGVGQFTIGSWQMLKHTLSPPLEREREAGSLTWLYSGFYTCLNFVSLPLPLPPPRKRWLGLIAASRQESWLHFRSFTRLKRNKPRVPLSVPLALLFME